MAYIEKEALIKTVCEQYGGAMNTFFAKPNDFVSMIEDAPAADVAEKKDCEQCKYFQKATYEYPFSHCRNCYIDKFAPKEG